MSFWSRVSILALVLAPLAAGAAEVADEFVLTSDQPLIIDLATSESVARGNARMTYREWTLTADEIRLNRRDMEATATGNVVLTQPGFRLLGESINYWPEEERFEVSDFRFGRPPYYVTGRLAHGVPDHIVFEDVELFYGEPGPMTPRATAKELTLINQERIDAQRLRVLVGTFPVLAFTGFNRPIEDPGLDWEARLGYESQLGVQLGVGAYLPLAPGFRPGGNVDIFSDRGVLFGPGVRYDSERDGNILSGESDLNFIHDTGDPGVDRLGAPIDQDRAFWTWRQVQTGGRTWSLNGEINWWSDSAVMRDFREDLFNRNQEPDTFLEASYNSSNYILAAFARGRPNDFQAVPERLPEVRFDLLPTPLGPSGVLLQVNASAASLRERFPGSMLEQHTDRLDLYAGVSRTFKVGRGITFTPVAGGRLTHYTRTLTGDDNYTRGLGEVGFDARLRAYRVREFERPLWGINGVRHVVEPFISYRFIPSAEKGRAFIPPIDRPAFLTQLQPLGLGERRDIDALGKTDTLRLGVNNILETRREDYGSRQLLRWSIAADFHLSAEGAEPDYSDVNTELFLTPADWLDWWVFLRFDPDGLQLDEFNTRIAIRSGEAWTLGVDGDYLRSDITQVQLFGRYRLNEANEVYGEIRYDGRAERFNAIEFGLERRIYQNWQAAVGLSFREGRQRESDFGLRVSLQFLPF